MVEIDLTNEDDERNVIELSDDEADYLDGKSVIKPIKPLNPELTLILAADNDDDFGGQEEDDDTDLDQLENVIQELTLEEFNDLVARKEADASPLLSQPLPALGASASTGALPPNSVIIKSFSIYDTVELKPGTLVELYPDEAFNQPAGDFLRIKTIIQDSEDKVFIRGVKFRRTKYLKGMLERKRNEVYMILRSVEDDTRCIEEQSLETLPVSTVACTRTLICTNQLYPSLSCNVWNMFDLRKEADIRDMAQLVCRNKHVIRYTDQSSKRAGRIDSQALERLSESEADPKYAITDQLLRQSASSSEHNDYIDLTKDEPVASFREKMENYHNYVDLTKENPAMKLSQRISESTLR